MTQRFLSAVCIALFLVTSSACGGSSPAAPIPVPTPVPTPTPNPEPTPTAPTPSPSPECQYGLCEAPTTNTNPVVTVIVKLYTVQDQYLQWIDGWPASKPIPVGYRIKLDATGKDRYNKDTLGDQGVNITWAYNDPSLVEENASHSWQPKLEVKKAGYFTATATFDGKVSNRLELTFVAAK